MAKFENVQFDCYTILFDLIEHLSSDTEELAISVPVKLWPADPINDCIEVYATYSVDGFQVFEDRPNIDEILSGSDKVLWYDCAQEKFDGCEPIAYILLGFYSNWSSQSHVFGHIDLEISLPK